MLARFKEVTTPYSKASITCAALCRNILRGVLHIRDSPAVTDHPLLNFRIAGIAFRKHPPVTILSSGVTAKFLALNQALQLSQRALSTLPGCSIAPAELVKLRRIQSLKANPR